MGDKEKKRNYTGKPEKGKEYPESMEN